MAKAKMTLHLIPEPEEKASELLHDLTANDTRIEGRKIEDAQRLAHFT
jgi:hypothetical protein